MDRLQTGRRSIAAGLAWLGMAGGAHAQQGFPERPPRWIVPYPPGGGSDFLARLLAQALQPLLGQPILIENRPGAASAIGMEAAAKAAPDGYTVATADNASLVLNPILYRRLPYDPERDLRAIGSMVRFHLLVCVRPDAGIATIGEFIARGRAEPGRINYGSPGAGLPHHLAMERLAKETGARFTVVHYRGLAPIMNDLLAGTVEAAVLDYAGAGENLRAGRIRPLAVCSPQRLAGLPEVPTVAESLGLAGFEAYAWQALVAPRATPDGPVLRWRAALAAALADPAVRQRLEAAGLAPLPGGADAVEARIRADRAVWEPLIKALGITLDL